MKNTKWRCRKTKYLVIKIVGHGRITAFKNDKKNGEKHPDFKADGVAVWVNEKRED